MLPTAVRLVRETAPYVYRNPYKAKRLWPPDFTKLSPKYQFRLERKYKRRTKLKWARPTWTKAVKLVQMASVTGVLVYAVLFLDWQEEHTEKQPFQATRDWFFGLTNSIWSKDRVQRRELDNMALQETSKDR